MLRLLETWRASGATVVLALEMFFARDQPALDAYLAGEIGSREFRRRVRYEEEWGYPWPPRQLLLEAATRMGVTCRGLDLPPRGSARDLPRRDAVAAERLGRWLEEGDAKSKLAVLIGEAHLARPHLPARLARHLDPGRRVARLFADRERAGGGRVWLTAGPAAFGYPVIERGERGIALTRTYRRWIAQSSIPPPVDLPLLVHSLIDAVAAGVGLDPRRRRMGPGCWLADLEPEVYGAWESSRVIRRLRECGEAPAAARRHLATASEWGAFYLPGSNVLLAGSRGLRGMGIACGHFLVSAFRGRARASAGAEGGEAGFWQRLWDETLAFLLALGVDPHLTAPALNLEAPVAEWIPALGGWLGEALPPRREGGLSGARLRRWLTHPPAGEEASLRRLAEMVRLAGGE